MAKMCISIMFALLVALHMGTNSVKASPLSPDDGDTFFDISDLQEYEMPTACEGKSFCFEKGDNYPEERIAELLKDMRDLTVKYPEVQTSIGDRKKRELKEERPTSDEPDCPSNNSIPPRLPEIKDLEIQTNNKSNPIYYIVDDNDRVRVVVQSPEKFMQIYSVRWCLNEGRITSDTPHFNRHLYTRFAIECVTKTMNFYFFVLSDEVDVNTNKPNMEIAWSKGGIPVCCKCQYHSIE